MKLEDEIRRAIDRHTDGGGHGDWDAVRASYTRAHRRRGVTRTVLAAVTSVSLVAGIAIGVARFDPADPSDLTQPGGVASFRYVTTMDAEGDGAVPQSFTLRGTVDVANGIQRVVADGDLEWEAIVSDERIWFRMLDESPLWLRAPILPDEAASFGGHTSYRFPADPSSYLEQLRTVARSVQERPGKPIGGAATTRYDIVLDAAKIEQDAPKDSRAFLAQAYGGESVTVWVDDEGLVREIRSRLTFGANGMTGTITATTILSGFGKPVSLATPPDDQVHRSVDSLFASFGRTVRECSSSAAIGSDGDVTYGPEECS